MSGSYTTLSTYPGLSQREEEMSLNASRASDMYGSAFEQNPLIMVCNADVKELQVRLNGAYSRSYPMAANAKEALGIQNFEIVLSPKRRKTGGQKLIEGCFTSLCGLDWGAARTSEELAMKYWFVGISRSNYNPLGDAASGRMADASGFAAVKHGVESILQSWPTAVYPGQKLIIYFPGRKEVETLMRSRSTTQNTQGKLLPRLAPLDMSIVDHLLNNVCQAILTKGNDLGVSRKLGAFNAGASAANSSPLKKVAQALKQHVLVTGAKTVEVLAKRGIITVNTPYDKLVQAKKDELFRRLIDLMNANGANYSAEGRDPGYGADDQKAKNPVGAAYLEYVRAVAMPKTNPFTGDNVNYPGGAEETRQPYSYFSRGLDLISQPRLDRPDASFRSSEEAAVYLRDSQMRSVRDAVFIADMLGVVGAGPNKGNEKSVVVQDILNAALPGHTRSDVKTLYQTGSGIANLNESLTRAEKNALNDYASAASEHLYHFSKMTAEFSNHIDNQTVGIALSYVPAGAAAVKLDVGVGMK